MSRQISSPAAALQPANRGAPGRRSGEAAGAYIRRLLTEGWLLPVKLPGVPVLTWAD
ncbi:MULTISPECIES: hypothetical protein [Xenophilus]|uniref:hypothetical protein n=1 Tax=Xenophilus TaxID=151754 RepID=UPI0012ED3011|nr:hypothetical protein [Xenophilus azovorans]